MREAFADEASIDDFDTVVWRHHDENKKELFQSLGHYDLVMGYFDLADAIGHLSFGVAEKMREVYVELEELAKEVNSSFVRQHCLEIFRVGLVQIRPCQNASQV